MRICGTMKSASLKADIVKMRELIIREPSAIVVGKKIHLLEKFTQVSRERSYFFPTDGCKKRFDVLAGSTFTKSERDDETTPAQKETRFRFDRGKISKMRILRRSALIRHF